MADKNPFGVLGLGNLGGERAFMYQGGPLTDALKGVKTGLIVKGIQASGLGDFLTSLGSKKDDGTSNPNLKPLPGAVPPVQSSQRSIPQASVQQPSAPTIQQQLDQEWGSDDDEEHSMFMPRNPALDQMPQQFAQGPVAPPMANIPQAQIPQSSGLLKSLLAFG